MMKFITAAAAALLMAGHAEAECVAPAAAAGEDAGEDAGVLCGVTCAVAAERYGCEATFAGGVEGGVCDASLPYDDDMKVKDRCPTECGENSDYIESTYASLDCSGDVQDDKTICVGQTLLGRLPVKRPQRFPS